MAKRSSDKKALSKFLSAISIPFVAIGRMLKKATAPIRANKTWIKARKTFLKSPFKGYFRESWVELKKVQWPDRKTSWKLTATVIVFSVTFSVFTTVIDVAFEKLAKNIFLK